MADYSIFSQAQGPSVDTDLYPRAMATGVNMGNAQKTTTQAIMEGVTDGIRTGQDIYGKYQASQVLQQQIDEAPLDLEIKKQKLENDKMINELNAMKLRIQTDTEAETIKAAHAEAKDKLDVVEGKAKFNEAAASGNPQKLLDAWNDPQVQAAKQSDAKLAEMMAGKMTAAKDLNGNPLLTPEQKEALDEEVRYGKKREEEFETKKYEDIKKAKAAEQYQKIADNMSKGRIGELALNMRLKTGGDWDKNVKITPVESTYVDKDGYLVPESKSALRPGDLTAKIGAGRFTTAVKDKTGRFKLNDISFSDTEADTVTEAKTYWRKMHPEEEEQVEPEEIPPAPVVAKPPEKPSLLGRVALAIGDVASEIWSPSAFGPATEAKATVSDAERVVSSTYRRTLDQKLTDPATRKYAEATGVATKESAIPVPTPPSAAAAVRPFISTPTPAPAPTPASTLTVGSIKEKLSTLPPEVKSKVDSAVMQKVFTNPLTVNLKPIEQALIMHESRGDPKAKSETGVIGLAQLTKDAATDMGVDRNDPAQNVEGGIRYFNRELNKYNNIYKGNTENNERLALMAYNGGPGAVAEAIDLAIEKAGTSDAPVVMEYLRYMAKKGRFPKVLTPKKLDEIEAYPDKVLAYKAAIERVTNVA